MIKNFLILIIIFCNYSILGNDIIKDENKRKLNEIYLIRNNGYGNPSEYNLYSSIFPGSFAYNLNSIQFNKFGFKRFLENSKFSLEGNFYEFKKTNESFDRFLMNSGIFTKSNLGTYYRSEQNLILNYHFIENRIIFNLGFQRIISDLSDSIINFSTYNFSQKLNGLSIGIILETPRIHGFFVSGGYKNSILHGITDINYSFVTRPRELQVFEIKDNPYTKYNLIEQKLLLGYDFNDSISITLGIINQDAKISKNKSKIIDDDIEYISIIRNFIESTTNLEYFTNTFVSITFKY